jgi:WD40 repeat protein
MSHFIVLVALVTMHTVSSNNGQFTGIVDYTGAHELKTLSFTLHRDGVVLYALENPAAITYFISNSGTVFACNEQRLYFYDRSGASRVLAELDYPNGFAFSHDNSLFFASDKNSLYVFSARGDQIATLLPCRLFAVNDHNSLVASVSSDTLYVQDIRTGDLLNRMLLKTPFVRALSFIDDHTVSVEEPLIIERFDCLTGSGEKD